MQPQAIYNQLTDLPQVFKPGDATYNAVTASVLAGLTALGLTTDSLAQQLSFPTASAEWLNLWGAFFGLSRNSGESDSQYQTRIQATLLGGTSTPIGIQNFILAAFGIQATVTEDFSTNSYTITFGTPLTNVQLAEIAAALERIRPAGIPFLPLGVIAGGMFTNTMVFLGMSEAPGAYLEAPIRDYFPTLAPNTNALIINLPGAYINFPSNFPTQ